MWVYIDDILIYSDTDEDHMKHIAMVCNKLKQAKFYASRKKSEFSPQAWMCWDTSLTMRD